MVSNEPPVARTFRSPLPEGGGQGEGSHCASLIRTLGKPIQIIDRWERPHGTMLVRNFDRPPLHAFIPRNFPLSLIPRNTYGNPDHAVTTTVAHTTHTTT